MNCTGGDCATKLSVYESSVLVEAEIGFTPNAVQPQEDLRRAGAGGLLQNIWILRGEVFTR